MKSSCQFFSCQLSVFGSLGDSRREPRAFIRKGREDGAKDAKKSRCRGYAGGGKVAASCRAVPGWTAEGGCPYVGGGAADGFAKDYEREAKG